MARPAIIFRLSRLAGWGRHSWYLTGGYVLVMGLIAWCWWPLARDAFTVQDAWSGERRWQVDWLLAANFLAMSLLISAKADLRRDFQIAIAGLAGGLAIECWGTQTRLWTYYTLEWPPLWIIPAWSISSVAIDRLAWLLDRVAGKERSFRLAYWLIFAGFYALMAWFVAPARDKSLTWAVMVLCGLIIITPTDHRRATLTFLAGSSLGYFLERWGTTRECWTYYTRQTPPLFAVLAHGMACVAFWRARMLIGRLGKARQKTVLLPRSR